MNILTLLLYTFITGLVLFYVSFNKRNRRPGRLPPGPTPWPIVGNLPNLSSAMHHSLASLAKKYGPLMYLRLGFLDVVVVSSSYVAEQFLKVHDGNFASRPPNSGAKYIGYNYQDMVFAPYGPRWRMLRKICSSHLFSPKTLDDFRRVRQEEVRILTRILVDAKNSPVKLGKLLSMCTANTLTQMMLGRRVFNSKSEGSQQKADEFKDMVVELMLLAGEINISDFIPPLECLDLQGLIKKMKKLHDRFDLFLNKIIEEHKTGMDNAFGHTDLLTTLISLKDDADGEGGKLTDIEIKALLLNLFVGGTDSSSLTVEWALAELISHPQLLKQAREEIDNVVGRDRLVTELDVSQLTFLQAVVKETFRLHPPAAISLPRIASESCEVNGYYIPKGSTLLVNVWAIARDPKVWTDPLKFQPSRFLPGGEKPGVDVKVNDFEVMPFGAGRRICVGMSLGLRMVQLLVATLVQAFDWELTNGIEPEKLNMDEFFGLNVQRAEPLMVQPRPRLAPHVYRSD